MLKLYEWWATATYDDYYGLVVAKSEEEAKEKANRKLDGQWHYGDIDVREAEVEGYRITVEEMA